MRSFVSGKVAVRVLGKDPMVISLGEVLGKNQMVISLGKADQLPNQTSVARTHTPTVTCIFCNGGLLSPAPETQ